MSIKMVFNSEKSLMRTGLFSSRTKMISYLLLRFIADKDEPAGSWVLREDLLSFGIDCSTATIGRYLKELDYREYTVQKSNQGRVLTPIGQAHLEELEYGELIELLYVRRALETEAARQAAINARAEDIAVLIRSVEDHRDTVEQNRDPTEPALEFHAVVADISHNKFICPILNMLIYEEKKIEAVMETLVTRERGRVYVKEHEQIAQAICDHDGEKAAQFMYAHIDELCKAVEEQACEHGYK